MGAMENIAILAIKHGHGSAISVAMFLVQKSVAMKESKRRRGIEILLNSHVLVK